MLSERMVKLLNDQIKAEFESEFLYLNMAVWCAKHGFKGAYKWFLKQAEEEREHAMKFINYLEEAGAEIVIPEIDKQNSEFESLLDVFEKGLEHEKKVSQRIFKLVEAAEEEKDHFTLDFLSWFVSEQFEEESSFRSIVNKLKLVGEGKHGIFMIDSYLGQRSE